MPQPAARPARCAAPSPALPPPPPLATAAPALRLPLLRRVCPPPACAPLPRAPLLPPPRSLATITVNATPPPIPFAPAGFAAAPPRPPRPRPSPDRPPGRRRAPDAARLAAAGLRVARAARRPRRGRVHTYLGRAPARRDDELGRRPGDPLHAVLLARLIGAAPRRRFRGGMLGIGAAWAIKNVCVCASPTPRSHMMFWLCPPRRRPPPPRWAPSQ